MAKSNQSKMIEIECPNCKAMLELDRGFAGGVCRCSKCGTLMTVPEDPSREKAETLSRPDAPGGPRRPSAPPSRPSAPAARADSPAGSRMGMPSPRPISRPATPPAARPTVSPQAARPSAPPAPPKPAPPAPKAPVTPPPKPPAPVKSAPPSPPAKPAPPPAPAKPAPAPAPAPINPPVAPPPAPTAPPAAVTPPPQPKSPAAPAPIVPPPPAPPIQKAPPAPEPEPELEPLIAEEDSSVIEPQAEESTQPSAPAAQVAPPQPLPVTPDPAAAAAPIAPQETSALESDAKSQIADDAVADQPPLTAEAELPADDALAQDAPAHDAPADDAHAHDAYHAADDEEVFVTASGKIIRVKKNRIVTAQTKRKVIRAGIIVTVAAVFVLLLIIGAVTISFLSRPTGPTPEEQRRQLQEATSKAFGFDRKKNPYTLTYPNYVGIKLKSRFVIILDASSTGNSWFGDAADIVTPGLKSANGTVTGQVAIAADGGAKFYPSEPKSIDAATVEEIAANLLQTYAGGRGDIVQAVDASLSANPEQIVLVTSETDMSADLVTKLEALLANYPNITVDLVVMEGIKPRPDMEAFIKSRKGTYAMLPASAIREWKKDAP